MENNQPSIEKILSKECAVNNEDISQDLEHMNRILQVEAAIDDEFKADMLELESQNSERAQNSKTPKSYNNVFEGQDDLYTMIVPPENDADIAQYSGS